MMKLNFVLSAALLGFCAAAASAAVVDFEELTQFTGPSLNGGGRYYNGNDGSGTNSRGWSSGGVFFNNTYDETTFEGYTFWNGWAYSDVANATSPGFENQYAAYPGGGAAAGGGVQPGGQYAIGTSGAVFDLPANSILNSVRLTNTTYAGLSLRDGDQFADRFGADSLEDLFRVTLTGYDAAGGAGNAIGTVDVELAYDRVFDGVADFILADWLAVDLSSIAAARSVGLSFFTTDTTTTQFGTYANTPLYVAMDNLSYAVAVPEPSSLAAVGLVTAAAAVRRRMRRRRVEA